MIRWAGTHSAYYRESFAGAGLRPEDIRNGDDLQKLPLLTPELLRDRFKDIVVRGVDPDKCLTRRTSGTTGHRRSIAVTRAEIVRESWQWTRIYRRYGLRWWHRQAKFVYPSRIGLTLMRLGRPLVYPRRYLSVTAPVEEKIAWLEKNRPHAVFGYATILYEIALALEGAGRRLSIPLVFSASEHLWPHMRSLIEDRLGGRAWDTYGSVETGPLACECVEKHGYHIVPGSAWIEVLDEQDRPARHGRVVCTVFWRRSTPLVRYDLGDEVEWTDEPCPCGRPGPRILALHGRAQDMLRLPDGESISWMRMLSVMAGVRGVSQYQMVERPPDCVEYRLVTGPEFEPEGRRLLTENFQDRVGDRLKLKIVCVESIPRSPGGKLVTVVRAGPSRPG